MVALTRGDSARRDSLDAPGNAPSSRAEASQGCVAHSIRAEAADRFDLLRRTIEGEVIPRLMLTLDSAAADRPAASSREPISRADVSELTSALLEGAPDEPQSVVDGLLRRGASRSDLLLELFAPAARLLGEFWEADAYNFVDVTIAMGRLQQALRSLDSTPGHHADDAVEVSRRILLRPAAGEQHTFALQILDVFFSRAGWTVDREAVLDLNAVCSRLKRSHVDVVGFTISREGLLQKLASDIQRVRRVSGNRSLVVLVGGRVFSGHPELVAMVGADGTADDARSAVNLAERMLPLHVSR